MEWHVWDFPDNIRIYLNSDFRELLYNKLIKICGTRIEIARRLKSNKETVRRSLYLGYRNSKEAYIDIKLIKNIIRVFGDKLGNKFLEDLEENVISYRSWNGWDVKNPKIPIRENPELYSIAFHLIGDGNASTRHSPFYSNKCEELLEEFKTNLQTLGNVETKTKCREDKLVKIYFPKAISDVLSSIFRIKFTFPDKLPDRIFQTSEKCKAAAIRAFTDDEGSVSSSFCITQKSSKILKQFKELLSSFNIKSGKICKNNNVHKLYIYKESYKEFRNSIGLTHPKKTSKLESKIKAMERYRLSHNMLHHSHYQQRPITYEL